MGEASLRTLPPLNQAFPKLMTPLSPKKPHTVTKTILQWPEVLRPGKEAVKQPGILDSRRLACLQAVWLGRWIHSLQMDSAYAYLVGFAPSAAVSAVDQSLGQPRDFPWWKWSY